jgi:immunity protein, SdpI family
MLVAAALLLSAVAFPHLPPRVPTHWGIGGKPDHFGSPLEAALLLPLVMLFIGLVFSFVPNYDRLLFIRYEPRDSDSSTVRPEYDRLITILLAFLLAMHTFAIASGLGLVAATHAPLLLAVVLSFGMIAIGNYMPRITRRNAFIGVRLPWAYASEEVWRRTQRAGGYGLVAAGVIGLAGAFAVPSAPVKPLFAALVAETIIVMVYSYSLARSGKVP